MSCQLFSWLLWYNHLSPVLRLNYLCNFDNSAGKNVENKIPACFLWYVETCVDPYVSKMYAENATI